MDSDKKNRKKIIAELGKISALLPISAGLFLFGLFCLKSPELPSWDTEITIPLVNDSYGVADLLAISNKFRISEDSTLEFYSEFNIDTITPRRILNLLAQNYHCNLSLSEFQIDSLYVGRIVLLLQDIVGFWLPESTIRVVIPPFIQNLNYLVNLVDIQSLELNKGIWKYRVCNFTTLSFDSLTLNSSALPYFRAIGIGANSTRIFEERVEQAYLENPIPVEIGISSPGSFPDSIYASGLDSIVIELVIDSLRVNRGIIRPPQTRAEMMTTINLTSDQRFRIDSLELATGEAWLNFTNTLPMAIWLNLSIEIIGYNQTFRIEPNGSILVPIPLAGLKLGRNSDMPSQGSNEENIAFRVFVNLTSEPGSDFVALEHDDGLQGNYSLTNLNFRFLAGELLQPIYISSPEKTLFSFPGQNPIGIKVARAEVGLHLVNTIGFSALVQFRTFARKNNGDSISQIQEITIRPGSYSTPSEINRTIPVTEVVNFGAGTIKFATAIRIYGRGRVDANSFARGNGFLSTPLRIAFKTDTTCFGNYRFSLSEKDRQAITDWLTGKNGIRLIDAQFVCDFANHFPIGFDGRLVITKDSISESTDSIVFPIQIPAGVIGGEVLSRHCTQATDSTITIGLNQEAISFFTNPMLFSHLTLYIPASDTVTIRPEDQLSFLSRAAIRLRVK